MAQLEDDNPYEAYRARMVPQVPISYPLDPDIYSDDMPELMDSSGSD